MPQNAPGGYAVARSAFLQVASASAGIALRSPPRDSGGGGGGAKTGHGEKRERRSRNRGHRSVPKRADRQRRAEQVREHVGLRALHSRPSTSLQLRRNHLSTRAVSVKAAAFATGAIGSIALPVFACLPAVSGASWWHDAHDHSPPCRLVKKRRPRSASPGAPEAVLKRSSCRAADVSAACALAAVSSETATTARGLPESGENLCDILCARMDKGVKARCLHSSRSKVKQD